MPRFCVPSGRPLQEGVRTHHSQWPLWTHRDNTVTPEEAFVLQRQAANLRPEADRELETPDSVDKDQREGMGFAWQNCSEAGP